MVERVKEECYRMKGEETRGILGGDLLFFLSCVSLARSPGNNILRVFRDVEYNPTVRTRLKTHTQISYTWRWRLKLLTSFWGQWERRWDRRCGLGAESFTPDGWKAGPRHAGAICLFTHRPWADIWQAPPPSSKTKKSIVWLSYFLPVIFLFVDLASPHLHWRHWLSLAIFCLHDNIVQ